MKDFVPVWRGRRPARPERLWRRNSLPFLPLETVKQENICRVSFTFLFSLYDSAFSLCF